MIRLTTHSTGRQIVRGLGVLQKGLATRAAEQVDGKQDTISSRDSTISKSHASAAKDVPPNPPSYQEVKEVKEEVKMTKKTMAELDEELKLKLEGVSGEGGNAGVEYEGGKAVGLKRGVRENMFRVI